MWIIFDATGYAQSRLIRSFSLCKYFATIEQPNQSRLHLVEGWAGGMSQWKMSR